MLRIRHCTCKPGWMKGHQIRDERCIFTPILKMWRKSSCEKLQEVTGELQDQIEWLLKVSIFSSVSSIVYFPVKISHHIEKSSVEGNSNTLDFVCVCYSFCIMVVVELKVARWYLKTSRSENIYLNSLLILNKARSSLFFLVEQFNLSLNLKLFVSILKSMDSGDVWLWNWISQFYSLIEFHQDYKL